MKAKHLVTLPLFFTFISCSSPTIIDNRGQTSGASDAIPKTNPEPTKPEPTKPVTPTPKPTKVDSKAIEKEALALLQLKCSACHSDTQADGGLGDLRDIQTLVESKIYLVVGKPEESEIYKRLPSQSPASPMPRDGKMTKKEEQLIFDWIKGMSYEAEKVVKLTDTKLLKNIKNDLETKVTAQDRDDVMYFTLQNINNVGARGSKVEQYRQAFLKTINSLSRSTDLYKLQPIDEAKLTYRVNVNSFLNANALESLIKNNYPFATDFILPQNPTKEEEELVQLQTDITNLTGKRIFQLRMDWFISTALLPSQYNALLNLGNQVSNIETEMGVNVVDNINNKNVIRSGFVNSGVSYNNRLLERHESNGRYYWLSYDFASQVGEQNLLQRPLAPFSNLGQTNPELAFNRDGGEYIFELPNGFMGFYLSVADGTGIEKGPTAIVSNKNGPAQFGETIINGISCFSCHAKGMLHQKDDIKAFAEKAETFEDEVLDFIKNVYISEPQFKAKIEKDSNAYVEAQKKAGIDVTKPDPITPIFIDYNRNLTVKDAIVELDISEDQLKTLLKEEPFKSDWVSLNLDRSSLKREIFNKLFGRAKTQILDNTRQLLPLSGDYLINKDCNAANAISTEPCIFPVDISNNAANLNIIQGLQ